MGIPHRKLAETELDEAFNPQFNPPQLSSEFTREDFYSEWKEVQSLIKAKLNELNLEGFDAAKDYTMADDWGYSRHHEIEIHNIRMFHKAVVPALVERLRHLPQAYEVMIEHDLFLRDEVDPCSVLVRPNEVLTHTTDASLLQAFGLSDL